MSYPTRTARPTRLTLRVLGAAALALFATACGKEADTSGTGASLPISPKPPGKTEGLTAAPKGSWGPVIRKTLRQYSPAIGSFRARQTTAVGPQVSGRVKEVLVDVGSTVTAGQDLVRLDPKLFEIEVAQRKADVEAARTAAAETELNFTRMRNLWEKPEGEDPSVPRKVFDEAKSRHEGAVARLQQAEGALQYAEERLRETVIRAPYDGVISKRLVDHGEPVTSTPVTHLLEIQEIGRLYLEFSLPQEMLPRVGVETAVEFDVEGGGHPTGSGKINTVFPAVDSTTRSFVCRLTVENGALKLRPGLLVRVNVVEQEIAKALVVPRRALSQTSAGWEVLVSNDGHPTPRKVEVGFNTGELVEIRSGVTDGEQVFVPEDVR